MSSLRRHRHPPSNCPTNVRGDPRRAVHPGRLPRRPPGLLPHPRRALTPAELAGHSDTAERYAREWLEHQAVVGVLAVDDASAPPGDRRFRLPPGPAEALTDVLSPAHLLPVAQMVTG